MQIINLTLATVIYLPFVKSQDKAFLAEEQEQAAAEAAEAEANKAEAAMQN